MEKPEFYEYFAECTPLLVSPALEPFGKEAETYWGAGVNFQFVPITRIHTRYYIRRKETLRTGKHIVKRLIRERKLFEKAVADFRRYLTKLQGIFKDIQKLNLKALEIDELIRLEGEINRYYGKCYIPGYLVEPSYYYLEHAIKVRLGELLKKRGLESKYSEYFVDLTPIFKEPLHAKEERDLLKLLSRIEKNPKCEKLLSQPPRRIFKELKKYPEILRNFKNHVKKYFWMNNTYASTPFLDEIYFIIAIKEKAMKGVNAETQLKELGKKARERRGRKRKIVKELEIKGELLALLDLVGKTAYFQDLRKTAMLQAVYYSRMLAIKIGERYGLKEKEILYALPREMNDAFLKDKSFRNILRLRTSNCLLEYGHDTVKIFHGEDAVERERRVLGMHGKRIPESPSNLLGICASLGYAVGRACIVNSSREISKVRKGDVLVAKATRPEMVPAMKLACAIVTNEGGITSHAAIVSRELGIPCVIGTKIATEVFKDGDLLEVRANHGAVYKLEE